MTDITAIYSWEHWSDFLYRLGAINTPADLQGFVTGLLAGGDNLDPQKWLASATEFMDLPEPLSNLEDKEAVGAYALIAKQALVDTDYTYKLLLPDDALSIGQRAEALGGWCQSFLLGFGMSGCDAEQLDEDGTDMLTSFAEIANIDTELEETEDNEGLYTQLCEFVRIAALYLFQHNQAPAEPNPAEQSDNSASNTVPPSIH